MDSEELLNLENIFIKLKNEGFSLNDIFNQLPNVDVLLLEKWNAEFEDADKNLPKGPQLRSVIVSKDRSGKYQYSNSINFSLSVLDKAKFDLSQVSSKSIDKFQNATPEQLDRYRHWISESKNAYRILKDHFEDLDIIRRKDNNVTVNFSLNTDDKIISAEAKKAVEFYIQHFIFSELQRNDLKVLRSVSKDVYESAVDIMPYAIKGFKILHYKGIIDTEILDLPIDAKWIFITGENSYGKTSILQALTIGLFGREDSGKLLLKVTESDQNKISKIGVEFRAGNQNILNNIHEHNHFSLKHLVCYGPSRLQVQPSQTKNKVSESSSVTYSMFNPDGVLFNIEYNLLIWHLEQNPRFEEVKNVLKKLIPYLSDIKIENNNVLYIEKEPQEDGREYVPLSFNDLASGIRSIVAMVGDLMIRLFDAQPYIVKPGDLQGIAIIDELDLHWHPKLQREIPSMLSALFPKVQFIATTHSVIPFLGAPKHSIFLKVKRNKEDGIKIEKIDIDITNLLPNILLTSSLFDMDNIAQINNNDVAQIRTEDSSKEMHSNDARLARIREFEQSNKKFPDNFFK